MRALTFCLSLVALAVSLAFGLYVVVLIAEHMGRF